MKTKDDAYRLPSPSVNTARQMTNLHWPWIRIRISSSVVGRREKSNSEIKHV